MGFALLDLLGSDFDLLVEQITFSLNLGGVFLQRLGFGLAGFYFYF